MREKLEEVAQVGVVRALCKEVAGLALVQFSIRERMQCVRAEIRAATGKMREKGLRTEFL